MNILICDDTEFITVKLNELINEYFDSSDDNFKVNINTTTNSTQAYNSTTAYDMAFLDIEMPDYNGFDVAKKLLELNSNTIIFIITSYQCFLD